MAPAGSEEIVGRRRVRSQVAIWRLGLRSSISRPTTVPRTTPFSVLRRATACSVVCS